MNKSSHDYIEQLFHESGLLYSKTKQNLPIKHFNFSDETILITGAAGSIGSQLAKHILKCSFKKLILVDIAESALYNLMVDVEQENTNQLEFLLLNITETDSVEYLIETYKPTLIFHAAAYKHVPLMEQNPYEAIKTNIIATKTLADISVKHEVKKFIFISTDKAVNPVSVMGISKLIAERYLNQLAKSSKTQFTITRFGNIFGSNGSVVPLFIKQLDLEIPLTITNSNMERYFISNHKACHLILELATYNKQESNLFTFNMEAPIKIIDIAKKLLELLGRKDYEIRVTDIRPGEKLHESMVSDTEERMPMQNKDIFLVKQTQQYEVLDINKLLNITPKQSPKEIKAILEGFI